MTPRFELAAVESIEPWGTPSDPSLSWFALSLGDFWIELGRDELFRYTPEVLAMWTLSSPHPDYQIAAFLRDLHASVGPALAPIPIELARIVGDIERLAELDSSTRRAADAIDKDGALMLGALAWRWLGERSPCMSYLVQYPRFHFVRIGDEIQIAYDNRDRLINGIPVWTAQLGATRLSIAAFVSAVTDVSAALLDAMAARLDDLEHYRVSPRAPVDLASLREQHTTWTNELSASFAPTPPEVPWAETLAALAALGVKL